MKFKKVEKVVLYSYAKTAVSNTAGAPPLCSWMILRKLRAAIQEVKQHVCSEWACNERALH